MSADASPDDEPLPSAIGGYRVVSRLAVGGMAEVFLAEHDTHPGGVVVKRLLPHLLQDERFLRMFRREARVALAVVHDHVVRTYELGTDNGRPFLAMEYVEGLTLKQYAIRRWLMRRPIGLADVAHIVGDIALALDHVHHFETDGGEGYVHRDISPENIMIATDGSVKLLDFGIAREEQGGALTRTGELKGKIPYMAPEQVRGERVTAASDLFSLGVTLYWALCRRRPFDRGSELLTMNAIIDDLPDEPIGFGQELPEDVIELMAQLLEKDPAARPVRGRLVDEALRPHRTAEVVGLGARIAQAKAKDLDQLKADWGLSSDDPTVTEVTPPDGRRTKATVAWRGRFQSQTKVVPPPAHSAWPVGLAAGLFALLLLAFAVVLSRPAKGPALPVTQGAAPAERPLLPDVAAPAPPASPTPVPAPAASDPAVETPKTPRVVARRWTEVALKGPPRVRFVLPDGGVGRPGDVARVPRGTVQMKARHTLYQSEHDVPVKAGVADFGAAGVGRLEFRVVPYAAVSVGDKLLGTTPFLPTALPAGRYTVRLVFEEQTMDRVVEVKAGETARVKANFTRQRRPMGGQDQQ